MLIRLILIYVSCVTICAALQILEPFEYYLNAPSSRSIGPVTFNITGEVVVPDPINSCTPLKNPEQVRGRIALVYNEKCSLETQARNAQAAGAIGVIQHQWATTQAGRDYFTYTDANRDDIIVPVVFINGPDGTILRDLTANSTSVVINMASGDRSIYNETATGAGAVFLNSLHCAIDLSLLLYALIKLIKYTMLHRTPISVAQVSLSLIIIALALAIILRIILLLGAFDILDVPSPLVIGSIFLPDTLLLLSSLVVSFYWFELTSLVSPMSRAWSKKLWRPFIAGGVILSVLLVLMIVWAQYILILGVFIAIFVVYALITLAIAIIWIVFGAKLRHTLLKEASSSKVQKNSRAFRRLIVLIIICACSLITTRFAAVFITTVGNLYALRASAEIGHFSFEITALMQILLFSVKKKKNRSGSRSSKRSTQLKSPALSEQSLNEFSS